MHDINNLADTPDDVDLQEKDESGYRDLGDSPDFGGMN
jgi:hypothetical protein